MAETVAVTLVGLGGYGEVYLSDLLDKARRGACRLVAAVDPQPRRCSRLKEIHSHGVPVFDTLGGALAQPSAGLVVISSPIQEHCSQTCLALERGRHVLCEKPAAATVQEVDRMIHAAARADRRVGVGFQWSFSPSIQQLKRDIQRGLFGQPLGLKTLCLWPRTLGYYRRNDWAGRLRDARGRWVLDSPANNAMAHFLHNLLYLLGDRADSSAQPAEIIAETYRANEIETFDTVALRVHTRAGTELLFYASHAVRQDDGPLFSLEFSRARIDYVGGTADIIARLSDGTEKRYAAPDATSQTRKLHVCAAAVGVGDPIPCGLAAAHAHTVCINGIHDSGVETVPLPAEFLRTERRADSQLVWADGLAESLRGCYEAGVLPSEAGIAWARPGKTVALGNYLNFPRLGT